VVISDSLHRANGSTVCVGLYADNNQLQNCGLFVKYVPGCFFASGFQNHNQSVNVLCFSVTISRIFCDLLLGQLVAQSLVFVCSLQKTRLFVSHKKTEPTYFCL